ncbi:DUF4258 domain-containing protein [Arthrobacter sp. TMS1-12-1]
MDLFISYHARNRMRQRGISEDDIREALANYHTSQPGQSAPICYIGTLQDGRQLQVCLSDTLGTPGTIQVVTAFFR